LTCARKVSLPLGVDPWVHPGFAPLLSVPPDPIELGATAYLRAG
jgi:hypothetical protein